MKRIIKLMFVVFIAMSGSSLVADCSMNALNVNDGCTKSACVDGQCRCTAWYHTYHPEAGSNCQAPSSGMVGARGPSVIGSNSQQPPKCTHWKLTSDEEGKKSSIQSGEIKESRQEYDSESQIFVEIPAPPTCKLCGHSVKEHTMLSSYIISKDSGTDISKDATSSVGSFGGSDVSTESSGSGSKETTGSTESSGDNGSTGSTKSQSDSSDSSELDAALKAAQEAADKAAQDAVAHGGRGTR